VKNTGLLSVLREVSECVALKERPPASLSLLRKRALGDISRLEKAFWSRGYHGARISFKIEQKQDQNILTFQCRPGAVYTFEGARFTTPEGSPADLPTGPEIGLEPGKPALTRPVLDARDRLISYLKRRGYPFPEIPIPKLEIDHQKQTAAPLFHVLPGPSACFGATRIQGLKDVSPEVVRAGIPWKTGDPFNGDLIEKARVDILATGLFSNAVMEMGETVDNAGQVPIRILLTERKHRTVKLGVGYRTDEGPLGKASWEHRNFLGSGENMNTSLSLSRIRQALETGFKKPDFLKENQSLLINLDLAYETPDAYTSTSMDSRLEFERIMAPDLTLAAGLGFRASDVDKSGEEERFGLLFLPLRMFFDTSDQPLNPGRGQRLSVRFAPYRDIFGSKVSFVKGFAEYRHYYKLIDDPNVVLALKGALGAIWGEERDRVPADLRFYAGGGGSVRGYPYQSIGPMRDQSPLGGRSLAECSAELRFRLSPTLGLAAFLDGGMVFESDFPDFEDPFLWGTGLGIRYFTPFGPLRLDLGIPLERPDGEDAFQIYISIGQAF
jgi:translocation and assembly module TamA